jgi:hypothetical protein
VEKAVVGAALLADKLGFPGSGLFRWALKSGQTPVETIVEQLESSAFDEITRLEKRLDGHDEELKEFHERLRSQEAQTAYWAAVFHGMRTSDPAKHERLGALTIRCVYAGDLKPESLDDMMRAVVELGESDLEVLQEIYKMQDDLFSPSSLQMDYGSRLNNIRTKWTEWWNHNGVNYRRDQGAVLRRSCTHLQSVGLISSIGSGHILDGPMINDYELLIEGKKFYERLQEIAADN